MVLLFGPENSTGLLHQGTVLVSTVTSDLSHGSKDGDEQIGPNSSIGNMSPPGCMILGIFNSHSWSEKLFD